MKIIKVIRAIINNPQNISEILRLRAEIYFEYKGKYKWSVSKGEDSEIYLHLYYQGNMTLEELSTFSDWENYGYTTYTSTDLEEHEDGGVLDELYVTLDNRESGIEAIFDDIIDDDIF